MGKGKNNTISGQVQEICKDVKLTINDMLQLENILENLEMNIEKER